MRKNKLVIVCLLFVSTLFISSYICINLTNYDNVQAKRELIALEPEIKQDNRDYIKDIEMARKVATKFYQLVLKGF